MTRTLFTADDIGQIVSVSVEAFSFTNGMQVHETKTERLGRLASVEWHPWRGLYLSDSVPREWVTFRFYGEEQGHTAPVRHITSITRYIPEEKA